MANIYVIDIDGQKVGVSEDGRVFGKRKELKQRLSPEGYPEVSLGVSKRTRHKVHRLVALAHLPNPDGLETVNHVDSVKTNNKVDNLEWCSRTRNVKLAQDTPVVAKSLKDKSFGLYYPCQSHASRDGFQQPNISKCTLGQRSSHKGYSWEKM